MFIFLIVAVLILAAVGYVATLSSARHFTWHAERKYPPRGKFVKVDAYKLHYVEAGSGQPVVLLHGDGGSVYDWLMSPLFSRLAEKYRVIAFDRPGLGYSERPADGWSPLVQARLIHGALHQLEVDRPVFVGHGSGGTAALAYAIQFPHHIAAVVGLAPGAQAVMKSLRYLNTPVLGDLLLYGWAIPRTQRSGFEIPRSYLNRFAFAPDRSAPDDYLEAFATLMARPGHARAYAADLAHSTPAADGMAARLNSIQTPLVILHGDADRSVPLANSERLNREIPHARLTVLPGTGHALQFNHPGEVLAAVHEAWEMAEEREQEAAAGL